MVKELLLAIILGATLGFMVTGSALGLIKKKPTSKLSPSPTPMITTNVSPTSALASPTSSPTSSLDITSPDNESIVDTAKITLQGTTTPNSVVIVTTGKNNYTSISNSEGNFSIMVQLDSGTNLIQVVSFDKNDSQQEKVIMVTYSTAKI